MTIDWTWDKDSQAFVPKLHWWAQLMWSVKRMLTAPPQTRTEDLEDKEEEVIAKCWWPKWNTLDLGWKHYRQCLWLIELVGCSDPKWGRILTLEVYCVLKISMGPTASLVWLKLLKQIQWEKNFKRERTKLKERSCHDEKILKYLALLISWLWYCQRWFFSWFIVLVHKSWTEKDYGSKVIGVLVSTFWVRM